MPPDEPQTLASPALEGTETVLIVEDHPDVAEAARELLADLGYTVLLASNGPAAMELLHAEASVDVLFTDLIIPGGSNGVALAREARRLRPALKVLLTTGYVRAAIESSDTDGTRFALLEKPYKRLDLARALRRVVAGGG